MLGPSHQVAKTCGGTVAVDADVWPTDEAHMSNTPRARFTVWATQRQRGGGPIRVELAQVLVLTFSFPIFFSLFPNST
jgi:hypothetical protein